MEDRICLDTDFIINFLRGREAEKKFVADHEGHCFFATTHINAFEVYYGAFRMASSAEVLKVEDLLLGMMMLPLTMESARLAGKIKARLANSGADIEFRDSLIAAIALSEGYAVKTLNKRHFERVEGLKLI